MADETVTVNRAPVLTLWGAVVAERQGHGPETALTLGKALAGLNAQSKGRSLGIFGPPAPPGGDAPAEGRGQDTWVELCGRPVPARHTPDGLRAVTGADAIDPGAVEKYLAKAFGDALPAVRSAMERLAEAYTPAELAEAAYGLYEAFRPPVQRGAAGWGQKGTLDLARLISLAKRPAR